VRVEDERAIIAGATALPLVAVCPLEPDDGAVAAAPFLG